MLHFESLLEFPYQLVLVLVMQKINLQTRRKPRTYNVDEHEISIDLTAWAETESSSSRVLEYGDLTTKKVSLSHSRRVSSFAERTLCGVEKKS